MITFGGRLKAFGNVGLLLVGVMTVISCGSSTKTASNSSRGVKPAVTRRVLSYNDEQRFKYFYLGAVDQQMKGNYAGAFDLLNHCQEINPDAAEVPS